MLHFFTYRGHERANSFLQPIMPMRLKYNIYSTYLPVFFSLDCNFPPSTLYYITVILIISRNKNIYTNTNNSHTPGLKAQCKKQESLPKLCLISGERMALQLTGGNWKLVPTVANGASITFIRSEAMASGPAGK